MSTVLQRFHLFLSMMHSRLSLVILFVIAGSLLAACNFPGKAQDSAILLTPTVFTRGNVPLPAETIPAPPTPLPDASKPLCLPFKEGVHLREVSFAESPQAILDFLNAGGSIAALDEALYLAQIANQPVAVGAIDLTGDRKQDVAVSIFDPASALVPPAGKLLIFVCQEGVYRMLLHQASAEASGAPGIRYLQDLNADGVAELVVGSPTCGASTCFEKVQILGWTGDSFEDFLVGSTIEIPSPVITLLDPQGDGVYDLEISGGGFGSVGAGPQRSKSVVWSYNPSTARWQDPQERLASSNYRIHVLQDAEKAARERHFEQALLGYERIVEDASLIDWMEPELEKSTLSAYALFKIALTHLLLNQPDQAQSAFDRLFADYRPGEVGYPYAQLAQAFQAAYPAGGIPNGCAAARQFAVDHPQEILIPLGSAVFGYANPDYSPVDICPWE
jgi:hypothetical protein